MLNMYIETSALNLLKHVNFKKFSLIKESDWDGLFRNSNIYNFSGALLKGLKICSW